MDEGPDKRYWYGMFGTVFVRRFERAQPVRQYAYDLRLSVEELNTWIMDTIKR